MDIKHIIANPDERIFAVFAGRSGSGKTTAAASLPRPLHEIDLDLRANGLINSVKQGIVDPEGIDIESFDPLGGIVKIQDHLNLLHAKIAAKQFNYKSLDLASVFSLVRLLELTTLNMDNTKGIGHIKLGGQNMTGLADYKFERQQFLRVIDYLRTFPCNVTLSAWISTHWGKPAGAKEGDPNVPIGETLNVTQNLAEAILGTFNDVWRFEKKVVNNEEKYYVQFSTDMAKNSFGIPPGEHDITRKNFWEYFQNLVRSIKDGTFKKPVQQSGGLTF